MKWLDDIETEFQRSREAQRTGQEGKVRVSARRAAGIAIAELQRRDLSKRYGNDVVRQLRAFALDEGIPPGVREAAQRLGTRLSPDFRSTTLDPISDARIIIEEIRRILSECL